MTLSSIVAIAKNNAIGKDNGMIWHLPEDLKHFKRTTLGKPILMGRKSYESLGKPLPGRPNFVISRNFENLPEREETEIFNDMESAIDIDKPSIKTTAIPAALPEGPFLYKSIEDGIAAMREMAVKLGSDEIFITGGGQIYKETLPYTDRLYVTVLDRDYDADVYFPQIQWDEWNIISEEKREADPEKNRPSFTFFTLDRKA
ncbi:MAG: dihydrofolate reductase [Alphaproteobacteria bacterium]|nr:dihydrofolate reductase [Alphaproteobacteria bacterium]